MAKAEEKNDSNDKINEKKDEADKEDSNDKSQNHEADGQAGGESVDEHELQSSSGATIRTVSLIPLALLSLTIYAM